MKFLVQLNKTSKTQKIFIQDSSSTTGAGLGSLVFNTSGLIAYYIKEGDSSTTAISLVTATLGTWSTGGFIVVDGTHMLGAYEIDLPNACFTALGSLFVYLEGAANMAPCVIEIQVVAFNPDDVVHLGLSALPNTACTTNASLITSGSGTDQLTVSSGVASADAKKINAVATTSVTTVNANIGTTQVIAFNANNFQKVSLNDILATTLTETSGQLAGGFKQWFNVATPTGTVNSLPNAVAGASNGVLISGSNAGTTTLGALTVTGATTHTGATIHTGNVSMAAGLNITQSTSNTSALVVTGNGTGHGAVFTSGSGATGDGVQMTSAATNGNGLKLTHAGTGSDLNATTTPLTLAKTTNITGFNDIAATAIVSSGAITTSGGAVSTVTTVGTLTTYTGNTPQTGDSFARIGSTGSGLTSLAPSATALSTAQWTNTLATNLGTLAGHDPGATLASETNITAGTITTVTNLTNAPTAGDFTATMKTSITTAATAATPTVAGISGVTFPTNFGLLAIDGSGFVTFNNSGIATSTQVAAVITNIEAHGDANWATATASSVAGAAVNVTQFNGHSTVGGKDWYHALWYLTSVSAGLLPTGAGTGTEAWQDFSGVASVTFTVDINGNRTAAIYG
jgi:hypothetical protein